MAKTSSKLLAWRNKQKEGTIMKPETFEKIKEEAKERYGIGEERASKVAGKAYWATAKAKFKKRKKRNYSEAIVTKARERV